MTELILNREHSPRLIAEEVGTARAFFGVATADLKDLPAARGKRMAPFLAVLAELAGQGAPLRLMPAKEPSLRFREDFDRDSDLLHEERFERIRCPRLPPKALSIDGRRAYLGSANLTGAGILADDPALVGPSMEELDTLRRGGHGPAGPRRAFCSDPMA